VTSVDVVIPNYNYAHLLPECVGSIQAQPISALRIVIIDNASQDDSIAVAERLAASDSRIEIVRHDRNIGPHGSFNHAVDLASADYFMILCADDLLVPGALARAVAALTGEPEASCVIGSYKKASPADAKIAAPSKRTGWATTPGDRFISRCCRTSGRGFSPHAILARTSVQKKVGHYRPSLPFMDDLEVLLRLARYGAVIELETPLALQRTHPGNLSGGVWFDRLRDLQERQAVFASFFAREGADMRQAASLARMARRRLAGVAYWSAASRLVQGRMPDCRGLLEYGLYLSRSAGRPEFRRCL
jgi:glycosyltransferase involved in cell wall biosynthesis